MYKLSQLASSRTFWTLVVMFAVNGYAAISNNVPQNLDVIFNLILTAAAAFYKVNPSQHYGE